MKIGKMFILPSSFTGSPRVLHQNFVDAMVFWFKKIWKFLTMTCNPKWNEIISNSNIVVKVFKQKVKELKEGICKKHIFEKFIAYTSVIEFQKRGLPHVHINLFKY